MYILSVIKLLILSLQKQVPALTFGANLLHQSVHWMKEWRRKLEKKLKSEKNTKVQKNLKYQNRIDSVLADDFQLERRRLSFDSISQSFRRFQPNGILKRCSHFPVLPRAKWS